MPTVRTATSRLLTPLLAGMHPRLGGYSRRWRIVDALAVARRGSTTVGPGVIPRAVPSRQGAPASARRQTNSIRRRVSPNLRTHDTPISEREQGDHLQSGAQQ